MHVYIHQDSNSIVRLVVSNLRYPEKFGIRLKKGTRKVASFLIRWKKGTTQSIWG